MFGSWPPIDSTTATVWDGAHIIAEYVDGSLAKKYIYGPGMDNPVAMVNVSGQTETWYYYYADALGSIRLLADASGAIVESYAYDVYGRPRVMTAAGADGNWLTGDTATYSASAVGNPYLFTGRRWDADTGLYHYRHRDYTPTLGRFLQPDPLGYVDGLNLYAYVSNNPLNWIDPWGLCKEENVNNVVLNPFKPGELWKDFLENPNHWIPEGPPIHEKPTNKEVDESVRQTYRHKYSNERIGTHDTKPRRKGHPHYVPPDSVRPKPIPKSIQRVPGFSPFLIIMPRFFVEPIMPRLYNPGHEGPAA